MPLKTEAQLTALIDVIKNETIIGANTKTRVASALEDIKDSRQLPLVSGTNIKTLNNISLLGSGSIAVVTPVHSGDVSIAPAAAPVGALFYVNGADGTVVQNMGLLVFNSVSGNLASLAPTSLVFQIGADSLAINAPSPLPAGGATLTLPTVTGRIGVNYGLTTAIAATTAIVTGGNHITTLVSPTSALTAVTATFVDLVDGASIEWHYTKNTITDLALTFGTSGANSRLYVNNAIVLGSVATLVGAIASEFYIVIKRTGTIYLITINKRKD